MGRALSQCLLVKQGNKPLFRGYGSHVQLSRHIFLSYLYESTFLNKCISFHNGRLTSAEPRNSFLHQPSVHMLLKPVKTKQLRITYNKTRHNFSVWQYSVYTFP